MSMMKNVFLLIGLLNLSHIFGQSVGFEVVESNDDSIDAELTYGDYLEVSDEFCVGGGNGVFYDRASAAHHCSNDPNCTAFYSYERDLDDEYGLCTADSKIYKDEEDSIRYDTDTHYKKECPVDVECGSNNFCYSGQCYERRQNQYCSGEEFDSRFYHDIEEASSICNTNGGCRCMRDVFGDGSVIMLYSSTLEGETTTGSCAIVKIGNYYEEEQTKTTMDRSSESTSGSTNTMSGSTKTTSGSGRSVVGPTLLSALIFCTIKLSY